MWPGFGVGDPARGRIDLLVRQDLDFGGHFSEGTTPGHADIVHSGNFTLDSKLGAALRCYGELPAGGPIVQDSTVELGSPQLTVTAIAGAVRAVQIEVFHRPADVKDNLVFQLDF